MRTQSSRMTPISDKYETCRKTFAELRIYGNHLDPRSITSRLGIEPTSSQKKGEAIPNSRGSVRNVKIGGWFLSSEGHVQSKDLRKHLDWLLQQLIQIKYELHVVQESEGIVMTVNCVWWSSGAGGPTLWPEQMCLLSELNLECTFELAFCGDEEQ